MENFNIKLKKEIRKYIRLEKINRRYYHKFKGLLKAAKRVKDKNCLIFFINFFFINFKN